MINPAPQKAFLTGYQRCHPSLAEIFFILQCIVHKSALQKNSRQAGMTEW